VYLAKLTLAPQLDLSCARADRRDFDRSAVLRFLKTGTPVLAAATLQDDRLEPARGKCVPLSFATDGEWIWPGELAYYFEVHGIWPAEAFLGHMRAHQCVPRPASEEALRRALAFLRDPAAVGAGSNCVVQAAPDCCELRNGRG
jgi:hypothetical protein